MELFSYVVFAGTDELLPRNICKIFSGARFDFLESLRKLSGCFDVTLVVVIFVRLKEVF